MQLRLFDPDASSSDDASVRQKQSVELHRERDLNLVAAVRFLGTACWIRQRAIERTLYSIAHVAWRHFPDPDVGERTIGIDCREDGTVDAIDTSLVHVAGRRRIRATRVG